MCVPTWRRGHGLLFAYKRDGFHYQTVCVCALCYITKPDQTQTRVCWGAPPLLQQRTRASDRITLLPKWSKNCSIFWRFAILLPCNQFFGHKWDTLRFTFARSSAITALANTFCLFTFLAFYAESVNTSRRESGKSRINKTRSSFTVIVCLVGRFLCVPWRNWARYGRDW